MEVVGISAPSNTTAFCRVNYNGVAGGNDASASFGVAPGFIIRKS